MITERKGCDYCIELLCVCRRFGGESAPRRLLATPEALEMLKAYNSPLLRANVVNVLIPERDHACILAFVDMSGNSDVLHVYQFVSNIDRTGTVRYEEVPRLKEGVVTPKIETDPVILRHLNAALGT